MLKTSTTLTEPTCLSRAGLRRRCLPLFKVPARMKLVVSESENEITGRGPSDQRDRNQLGGIRRGWKWCFFPSKTEF